MRQIIFSIFLTSISLVCFSQESGHVYRLAYLDVQGSDTTEAESILKAYGSGVVTQPGNIGLELMQRVFRSNQFVVLETWKDQESYQDFTNSPTYQAYLSSIKPYLTAGYAEYRQTALDVATSERQGEITLVTHVDIMPPRKEQGTTLLVDYAGKFRKAEGNTAYNLIVQPGRLNHITVVESWANLAAYQAHSETPDFKAYRHALQPLMGSLYDERLYKLLD
jgi:quinol monooxygenase YgiN